MKEARQAIEKHILSIVKAMEPKGTNHDRYKELFENMNDDEFSAYMDDIESGKRKLIMYTPNMKVNLKMNDLLDTADKLGVKIFERLRLWDKQSNRYFTTPVEYLVLNVYVRRLKQHLFDKMVMPESDRNINLYTGQVVKPDKGSSMSGTGVQTLLSKGLTHTLTELFVVRGGNIGAYATLKSALEETGSVSLNNIDATSRVRSVVVANIYLKAMMLDNNL